MSDDIHVLLDIEDNLRHKKLIANEKVQSTAFFINGIAIALTAIGLFGIVATLRSIKNIDLQTAEAQGLTSLTCIGVSFYLHFRARNYLGDLK